MPATATTLALGTSFIHVQGTSAEVRGVQSIDGAIRLVRIGHFHKTKTARSSGVTILHDADAFYGSIFFKQGAHRFFGSTEIEISDENILHTTPYWVERALRASLLGRDISIGQKQCITSDTPFSAL